MVCISFTEGDVVHFPSKLLCRSLVWRVRICEWSFPCFSNIAVLGSSRLSGEVSSFEDGPNFARRFCLALVNAWLGASVTDVISDVPVTDEFLDLILEHDTLLCGMAACDIDNTYSDFFWSSLLATDQAACRCLFARWPRRLPHATQLGR